MNNSNPPSTDAVPAEPTRIGHYELRDCIGRGGMGLVYRALDTRLDRQVAIKCLRTELFEAHYVERFKREALLLAKLNHPNIVQIYDFIEAPDQIALVMELVEGQNLQLHLREHIVPFAQRMRWLTEIAQGLAVAHDTGIIHRDLKAENILINQRKVAKITDLGIAKSQDFNATLTDHVAGSYCSMSPEQAMGEPLDFKSDLFSFGILAYQLLCGAHPFGDTNNKLQLMQRIISHPPIAPGKHNPDLPPEINDLLGQLLSKDPDKRPDNTHWVAAQLEKLSHLQLANDFVSDDTQALIPSGNTVNQSNVKNTGIHSAVRTQDHPTFETRFAPIKAAPKKSHWLPIKNYLTDNKISVGVGLFSALILAAVVVWQLQPKPPKYIAVIPPKLTAEGMQESQQELVKGAVYEAIQQIIIQLDGYYLIPRNEIIDVNGDNETVRNATGADELITAELQCKIEACTITLSRLAPENDKSDSRLRVHSTKSFDVLNDRYISVMETTQNSIGSFYSKSFIKDPEEATETDYKNLVDISINYRDAGATPALLGAIDALPISIKKNPSVSTLYKDISLDLYYETNDEEFLKKLASYIKQNTIKNVTTLYNSFYLEVAKANFEKASAIIKDLESISSNSSSLNELRAYAAMAQNDYEKAISLYKESLKAKTTANNLYNIANAYRYNGNNDLAKKYINQALELSPKLHQANSLLGFIALFEGDLQQATISFATMVEQNSRDISNLTHLGLSQLLTKNYAEAKKNFSAALKLSPENTTLLLNLADIDNLEGKKEESQLIYENVISLTKIPIKNNADLRNLAQSYAHLNKFSAALASLEQLEKADPQNIETTYTAALVHTLASNKKSAIFNIEKSLKNNLSTVWFRFSWFDSLCNEIQFTDILKAHGEPYRCTPLAQ